ncbi:hypothetical protein GCM10009841_24270 [Microlunatus panaciterrae]|uniref:DUF2567 domain-containing protein n=1 Tax=Microlunatus panaciterrae TaxID=400768 RepID=A0ABS2RE85_9ACTN|nr:hypothetical protein [Microlunatus panaciterrae]MBM7797308.1 hypothetical protein [Microlunatus panaciterrae]
MSGVLTGTGQPLRRGRRRTAAWIAGYLLLSVIVGGLAGVAWWRLVHLPAYRVSSDGGAATTERGLTEFFASDAWFTALGLVVGVGLGIVAWRWFARLGWPLVLLAALGALLAGFACWYLGYRLGPGPFEPRLAAAQPGQYVPIELTVRAKASFVVWPFAATLPILLRSSLGPDDEDPRPFRRPRR